MRIRTTGGLVLVVLVFACTAVPFLWADEPTAPAVDPLVPLKFDAGDPGAVVVQGDVKLHRREVDGFLNLLRTAFEAPIPSTLEAGLRTQMAADFGARGILGRQAWLKLVDPWPQIAADLAANEKAKAREGLKQFRLALDKRMRMFPDARVNQLVARLLKRQSEILLPGPPEVSGLAADVYLDVLVFVATLGRNEAVRLTDGQRSVLADNLREQFKTKSKDDHDAVRKIADAWNRVRTRWSETTGDEAFQTRVFSNLLVYRLLPGKSEFTLVSRSTPADVARRGKDVCRAHGKLDTLSGLSANPTHVWKVLKGGLGLGR